MSKSLEYALGKLDLSSAVVELEPEQYFDEIMHGEREKIKETPWGLFKTIVTFDENAEFNYLNSWSGERCGFEDDLEDQIMSAVDQVLNDDMHIPHEPLDETQPLGGWPSDGDAFDITFGNVIVDNSYLVEDDVLYQRLHIAIPMKYKLIKGGCFE